MMRKIVIALAAGAIIAGSAIDASARGGHGGGGGGGGMGGHGGMGGMSMGHASMGGSMGMGRASMGSVGFARMGGPGIGRASFGRVAPFSSRVALAHPGFAFRDHRFAFRDRRFRFRNRFIFAAAFPFGYYNGCYERVWTRWGWRLINVCGPYAY